MLNYSNMMMQLKTADPKEVLRAAVELRDKLEIVLSAEASFLPKALPHLCELMGKYSPEFTDSDSNKIRHVVLELLSRLPHSDAFKPHAASVMALTMKVLAEDNEDNAVLAVKIIFELHKSFRPMLEPLAHDFLLLVVKLYSNMKGAADRAINSSALASDNCAMAVDEPAQRTAGMESFRVLQECPLVVMLLFQFYPAFLMRVLPQLIPLMVSTLLMSSSSPGGGCFKDLLLAQVKTLSFVTYLLRSHSDLLRQYEADMASTVLSLLASCPADATASRKEILVATRHIIATDFRNGFFAHIDTILSEDLLLGAGRPVSLRPLAYTTLSDFVQYSKEILSVPQIMRVVGLFNTVLHDATLPSSIHAVAIKMLVRLVEILGHDREQQDEPISNTVLFKVFKSLVGKLNSLSLNLDKAAEVATRVNQESAFVVDGASATWFRSVQNPASPCCTSASTASGSSLAACYFRPDYPVAEITYRDIKILLKAALSGIKPLVSQIENMKISNESSQMDKTSRLKKFIYLDKMKSLGLFFQWTLQSCTVFPLSRRQGDGRDAFSANKLSQYDAAEVKDMLELFTGSLTSLHTDTLRLLLRSKIGFLIDMTLSNSIFLVLFQQMFNSAAISAHLMDITLSYFLSNVFSPPVVPPSSGQGRSKGDQNSTILLRIFKFMLVSISVFPENEKILITRLPKLITSLLRFAMVSKSIIHECNLLRLVFRSISGGKMEMSINAISPIYELILEALERLLARRKGKVVTNIILDLSLTVPARVSKQLAHLPLLLKFVSLGLRDQNDIASVALKSLELWLDHSTPAKFVASIDASLSNGLIEAVMLHLKPPPYQLGLFAFRVLGKMGGHSVRSLRSLRPAADASAAAPVDGFLSLHTRLHLSKEAGEAAVSVDLTLLLLGACELLEQGGEGDLEQSGDATQPSAQPRLETPPMPASLRALYGEAAAEGAAVEELRDPLDEWLVLNRPETLSADPAGQREPEVEAAYIGARLLAEQKRDAFDLLLAAFAATTTPAIAAELAESGCCVSLPKAARGGAPAAVDLTALLSDSKLLAMSSRMVTAVLWAATDAALGARAQELLAGLCFHYAFLLLRPGSDTASLDSHSFSVINDVIVSAYCHAHQDLNQQGAALTAMWVDTLRAARSTLGIAEPVSTESCSALQALVAGACRLLCSCSFNDALAGARLLSDLSALFAASPMWCGSQLQLVLLSLLEALQLPSLKTALFAAADVLACLRAVLSSCLSDGVAARAASVPEESLQLALCKLCCDSCPHVRRAAKVAMGLIAAAMGVEVETAMAAAKVAVVGQLHLACTGLLDEGSAYGLVYFMQLGFIAVDSNVVRCLSLWLAAAEAQAVPADPLFGLRSSLGCADPPADPDGAGIVLAASMHPSPVPPEVACCLAAAHLLHAVMAATTEPALLEELFPRTCAFLFKLLCTNEWGEAVDAAGAALAALAANPCLQALCEQHLTKEVVEESLKPAFVAIQDMQLLSRQLLRNFQVILRAFPEYFSFDNFASRLVEYLQVLSEPEKNVTMNVFVSGEEHLVAVHLVTLFALVPSAQAIMAYFEDLVLVTVDLDQNCHRYWYSNNLSTTAVYAPLVDIICKYRAETMAYFFDTTNLAKPKILYFLLKILKLEAPLRDKFVAAFKTSGAAAALQKIVLESSFDRPDSLRSDAIDVGETLVDAAFHGVALVRRLAKVAPRLLEEEPGLAGALGSVWRRTMAAMPAHPAADPYLLVINQTDRLYFETKGVCKCLVSYCRACPDDCGVLFSLVDFLLKTTPVDLTFLQDFLRLEVPRLLDSAQKRRLLAAFVSAFAAPATSAEWKAKALQALVLPTLVSSAQSPEALQAVLDADLVLLFVADVLKTMDGAGPLDVPSDALRVELLKVSSLLLEHASALMRPYKKDLIKAPWNCIKSDEPCVKYWAYVCICRFIAAFESPAKIIIQVYVALLRSSPHESKDVVRLALDVLVPALPLRLSPEDFSKCMKWTKRLLFDEALNNIALLAHIWSVVVRHCKTFYPFRAQLAPQMVSTISRIGLPPTTSMEYRQLALSMADTIVGWEWARRHGVVEGTVSAARAGHKRASAPAAAPPTKRVRMLLSPRAAAAEAVPAEEEQPAEQSKAADFALPPPLLTVLANFVVRFGFFIAESKDVGVYRFYPRCLGLFRALVLLFPFRDLRLTYFEKMIRTLADSCLASRAKQASSSSAQRSSGVSESLLLSLLEHILVGARVSDVPECFFAYVLSMKELVEPIMESENPAVFATFRQILSLVVAAGPPLADQAFFQRLGQVLERGLLLPAPPVEQAGERRVQLQSLVLLRGLLTHDARWGVLHGSALMRLCQQQLGEHLVRAVRAARYDPLQSQADAELNMFTAAAHPTPWSANLARCSGREPAAVDDAPPTLLLAMQCLLIGVGAGALPQQCGAAVALLSSVLESSNSPSLLGLAVRTCSEWVLVEAGPLSSKNRWQLFKQACKAWGRLPELALQAFALQISRLALDVSAQFLAGGDAFARRFGAKAAQAVGRGVLPLAAMSPLLALRSRGLGMLCAAWGASADDKLSGFLRSELLYLSHRYFPLMLSQLLLQSCDASALLAGAAPRPALAPKGADQITLSAEHPYSLMRARLASDKPVAALALVENVSLSHAAAGDSVWRQLLCRFWDSSSPARREALAAAIERFVLSSKPSSTLLWPKAPGSPAPAYSAVQGLMRALGSTEHPPRFSPEFLGATAVVYSVWHEAHHFLQPLLREADEGVRHRALLTAVRLHEQLEDTDSALALLRLHGESASTALALSLESHGRAADAQTALLAAIRSSAAGLGDSPLPEAATWQRRWVANAKELGCWGQLSEAGRRLQSSELRMEASVMQHCWEDVRALKSSASVAARGHWTNLGSKTREIMLAIADRRSGDCDRLCAQAIQVALMRWQQLPPLAAGSTAHKSILHSFHRIVELRESSATMAELGRLPKDKVLPESKNPAVWKSRLPDRSETFHAWSAVLHWRRFMYDSMRRALPGADQEETAHCSLLLAKAARHHGLPEAVARALPAATGSKETTFLRVREQVLLSLSAGTDVPRALRDLGLLPQGLEKSQAAEVQRLRGLCLHKLGATPQAQEAFSSAARLDGASAKAWLSWGHFCHDRQRQSGEPAADPGAALDSAVCVLKAVELGSQPARMLLGRVVQALSLNAQAGETAQAFLEAHCSKAALWAWLPYLPALLNSLLRRGCGVFKGVLLRLAKTYPQAVLFHIIGCGLVDPAVAQGDAPWAAGEELRAAVRGAAAQPLGDAHRLCERARPSPAATLAATLSAVLAALESELTLGPADLFPTSLARRIEAAAAAAARRCDSADPLLRQLLDECAVLTKTDARPKTAGKVTSAGDAAAALRAMLQSLADRDAAPLLAAGPSPGAGAVAWSTDPDPTSLQLRARLELPGQYDCCSFREPSPDQHLCILAALPGRSLRLLLSDGTVRCFEVLCSGDEAYNCPEALAARVQQVADWALLEHHRSRRMDLTLRCPRTAPLATTLLLREAPAPGARSLQSLLEAHSMARGEVGDPLLLLRARAAADAVLQRAGRTRPDDASAAALEAYSACADRVPASLLASHLVQQCQIGPHSAQSRRAFAAQLGAHSLMQLLLAHSAFADEMTVSSGGLISCSYSQHGSYPGAEGGPPFRLTRNVATCVPEVLLLGTVGVALGAAADALLANSDAMESTLELFFASSAQALANAPAAAPAVQAARGLLLRIAPASQRVGVAEGAAEPVDAPLLALLAQAAQERSSAEMPLSALPWM